MGAGIVWLISGKWTGDGVIGCTGGGILGSGCDICGGILGDVLLGDCRCFWSFWQVLAWG